MKPFLTSPSRILSITALFFLSTTMMGCATPQSTPKATFSAQPTNTLPPSTAASIIPITTKTKAELGIGTPITISAEGYEQIKDLVNPIRKFYTGSYWLELTDADMAKIPVGVEYKLEADAFIIKRGGYQFDPLLEQPDIPPELQAAPTGENEKGLYLIQFVAPAMNDWIIAVKNLDIEWLGGSSIGYGTRVWATPNQLKTAQEQFDFIRAWAPFHAKYKINPRLLEQTGVIDWVNVVYYTDSNPQTTIDAITSLGGEIKKASAWDGPGYNEGHIQTKIDSSKLSELARLPQVMSLYKGAEDTFDE